MLAYGWIRPYSSAFVYFFLFTFRVFVYSSAKCCINFFIYPNTSFLCYSRVNAPICCMVLMLQCRTQYSTAMQSNASHIQQLASHILCSVVRMSGSVTLSYETFIHTERERERETEKECATEQENSCQQNVFIVQ